MTVSRRSVITGLVALVAAPAIVRAGSLMPVKMMLQPWQQEFMENNPFIPNETARLDVLYGTKRIRPEWSDWSNSPGFIERINAAYDEQFSKDNAKIGDVIRIRLPVDFIIRDGPALLIQEPSAFVELTKQQVLDRWPVSQIPNNLALAAAAVAIAPVVLAKPVTRRFWAK